MEEILPKILMLVVLVISVAIHEFAHCWTTYRLGDDTPMLNGRVTLNPLAHLDPWGTVMMVITVFSGFGFGWGKPSPMNPMNFANPARDRMISALAGPVSNLMQMLVWASLGLLVQGIEGKVMPSYDISGTGSHTALGILMLLCLYGVVINAVLAIFNLIPIYPLDGHHILSFLVPPSWRPIIENPAWMIVFLLLVFSGKSSLIIEPLLRVATHATQFVVGWPPLSG